MSETALEQGSAATPSPGRTGRRWRALAGASAVAAACVGLPMLGERTLIYFPTRYPDGGALWETRPGAPREGQPLVLYEDQTLVTSDGLRLHGWWCRPARWQDGAARPAPTRWTLLWLHGNAGNLAYRRPMLEDLLAALPLRVLLIDYRGYGKSEGQPDEQGLQRDARAAWDQLTGPLGVAPGEVVILGKSLGGGTASWLAGEVRPAGLILQSTFTSVPDMARLMIPFLPRFLVRTRMDSLSRMPALRCPLLVVHSPADEVIPYAMGRRLFEAAPEPKRFLEIPGAGHNETWLVGGSRYLEGLRAFLESLPAR